MLKRIIAQRLNRYIKGFSHEQVSTRLLSGELTLKDVEVDLQELADLLVGALPYTLELRLIRCSSVSVRVPWKALRSKPLRVELRGLAVELVVHPPGDRAWLAAQTWGQHQQLLRGAIRAAEDALREEEEELPQEQNQARAVRVGLRELIPDGLRVSLEDARVSLLSAAAPPPGPPSGQEPPESPAGAGEASAAPLALAVTLALEAVTTVPCTRAHLPVERPEDVYEISDPYVRVHRLVEVRGLKVLAPGGTQDGAAPEVLLEHADAGGPVRVSVEQRRFAGFIPHHHARRVCPFSSEAIIRTRLGQLSLAVSEARLREVALAVANAARPPYVPIAALPPDLVHLHWGSPDTKEGPPVGQSAASGDQRGSETAPSPPGPASRSSASEGLLAAAAAEGAEAPADVDSGAVIAPCSPSQRAERADCLTWSEPAVLDGVGSGLEAIEQFADRRTVRVLAVHLSLATLRGELQSATDAGAAHVLLTDFTFSRDALSRTTASERGSIAELGFFDPSSEPAQSPSAIMAPEALAAPQPDEAGGPDDAAAPPAPLQKLGRHSSSSKAAGGRGEGGAGAKPGSQSRRGGQPSGSSRPGASGAPAKPRHEKPLMCLNAVALGSIDLAWHAGGGSQRRCLLSAAAPTQAVSYRWKEIPPQQQEVEAARESSWQPVEGCLHGIRLVLDLDAWRAAAGLAQRCLQEALRQLVPPPFEARWCRLSILDLKLEIPTAAARGEGAPSIRSCITVAVPAALLTSLLGVGELLCALNALPASQGGASATPASAADTVAGREAEAPGVGAAAAPSGPEADDPAPSAATRSHSAALVSTSGCWVVGCACGRELADGVVRVTNDAVPVRTCPSATSVGRLQAGTGRPADAGIVTVRHAEFVELMRAQTVVEAWTASLPCLQQYLADACDGQDEDQGGRPLPAAPQGPARGHSGAGRAGRTGAGAATAGAEAPAARGHEAEALAERWASMQETTRRLQLELREAEARCTALRGAAAAEAARARARAGEEECRLAALIAAERSRQAELSARAQEQRRSLARLLQGLPACAGAGT